MNIAKRIFLSIFVNLVILPEMLSTAVPMRGTKEVLGRSVFSENGSDFKILSTNSSGVQTDKDAEHRFLVIGGTHGDEIMTTEFVAWLYKRTASVKDVSQMGDNVVFDFIPVLNIDNFGKSRYNKNRLI